MTTSTLSKTREASIEQKPEMTFAGMRRTYTPSTREQIPNLWHEFGPRIGEVPNGTGGMVAYGIVIAGPASSEEFDYMAAVEVSSTENLPGDFVSVTSPAGKYAVYRHDGPVSELSDTIMAAVDSWAPAAGLKPRQTPGLPGLIEWYGENFDPQTGMGDMEVWLAIQ